MVFNSGFDSSLWLILVSDKKYRFDIAKFIYDMPKDLYDSICNQLMEYDFNKDDEWKCFRKALRDEKGINSYYYIEMNSLEIRINLKRWDSANDKLQENISLMLNIVSLDELELEDSLLIGKYNYNSSRLLNPFSSTLLVSGDERNYEIYENDGLKMKISITDDNDKLVNVDLRKMPRDFDLVEMHKVNVLVKGRKKK